MRLWHYELISVLPTKMLVSQWRECIAIKRQWEKGTLNHSLVKYVMNHGKEYFYKYILEVTKEMEKRNIKFQKKYLDELMNFTDGFNIVYCNSYYPEHNERYLIQCYYNLQEKYDRGLISEENWKPIENLYQYEIISSNNDE